MLLAQRRLEGGDIRLRRRAAGLTTRALAPASPPAGATLVLGDELAEVIGVDRAVRGRRGKIAALAPRAPPQRVALRLGPAVSLRKPGVPVLGDLALLVSEALEVLLLHRASERGGEQPEPLGHPRLIGGSAHLDRHAAVLHFDPNPSGAERLRSLRASGDRWVRQQEQVRLPPRRARLVHSDLPPSCARRTRVARRVSCP